ncbi:MAG: collagen-binding domain-containing protein, partial [bacterium]
VSSTLEVQLNSSVDFSGVIYAPNAHVVENSGVEFYGSIMAQEVTLNSSVAVHYDEALDELALLKNVGIDVATIRPILVQ